MRANSNQGALALYTDLEAATAQQLAYERNRDTPSEKDLEDAVRMCSKWNKQRQREGMRAWQ
jgi:hypothetical protein